MLLIATHTRNIDRSLRNQHHTHKPQLANMEAVTTRLADVAVAGLKNATKEFSSGYASGFVAGARAGLNATGTQVANLCASTQPSLVSKLFEKCARPPSPEHFALLLLCFGLGRSLMWLQEFLAPRRIGEFQQAAPWALEEEVEATARIMKELDAKDVLEAYTALAKKHEKLEEDHERLQNQYQVVGKRFFDSVIHGKSHEEQAADEQAVEEQAVEQQAVKEQAGEKQAIKELVDDEGDWEFIDGDR